MSESKKRKAHSESLGIEAKKPRKSSSMISPVGDETPSRLVVRPPRLSPEISDTEESASTSTIIAVPKKKRDKGKTKESEVPETRPESPTPCSDDEEIDFNFEILEIDREITIGSAEPGRSSKLVTEFPSPAYICHMDHMAPFRGIVSESRDNLGAAGMEISGFFRNDTKKKLLAAATGHEFTTESRRAIIFAIEKLLGKKPIDVTPVRKSAWAVVTMDAKEGVKKLIEQKAAFDPLKRMLVVFRMPTMRATSERLFEVKNAVKIDELDHLRSILIDEQKVTIVEEVPRAGEWTSVFDGRVVWKVTAPNPSWQIPNKALVRTGNYLYLTSAPICDICHSDDHHFYSCPWKTILPDANFRKNNVRK
jgi:hypothetical protein